MRDMSENECYITLKSNEGFNIFNIKKTDIAQEIKNLQGSGTVRVGVYKKTSSGEMGQLLIDLGNVYLCST